MLTFTAIVIGLMIFERVVGVLGTKIRNGWDLLGVLLALAFDGVIVWQFFFRMLPLAWGAGD